MFKSTRVVAFFVLIASFALIAFAKPVARDVAIREATELVARGGCAATDGGKDIINIFCNVTGI